MLSASTLGITASSSMSQKKSNFGPQIVRNFVLTAANYYIGLNPNTAQFFDTVLGGFGFQLLCGCNVGN